MHSLQVFDRLSLEVVVMRDDRSQDIGEEMHATHSAPDRRCDSGKPPIQTRYMMPTVIRRDRAFNAIAAIPPTTSLRAPHLPWQSQMSDINFLFGIRSTCCRNRNASRVSKAEA
jgi:hypothetical protein